MREILIRREATMGQLGFFDADKRLQALSARGDPLEAIDHLVPWESFRAEIEAVVLTPDELKKSSAEITPIVAMTRTPPLIHIDFFWWKRCGIGEPPIDAFIHLPYLRIVSRRSSRVP